MGSAAEINLFRPGGTTAAADLSTKQFYAVKMTSTGINLAGDGERVDGVLQNKPTALGQAAEVETLGLTKAIGADAIAQGASVASDANGKFVTAASGDYIAGTAWTACGADGELFTVLLRPEGRAA